MCGIVGCALVDGSAAPVLLQALRRLEYRGYDSAGLATVSGGGLFVKKDVGRIDEVDRRVNFCDMAGCVGVAHTRWATHGAPSQENAHPHVDCRGLVAVVHNGVIENFYELRVELEDRGHVFRSRTDSEVVAHLVEEGLAGGRDFFEAFVEAVRRLRGSYALAAVSPLDAGRVFCARCESPLVLGVSDGGVFCASDVAAILPYTKRVLWLKNGEVAVFDARGYEVRSLADGSKVERGLQVVDWSVEDAEKQGYPHFMLKEIYEQPMCLRNALRLQERYLDLLATLVDRGREVFLVGCGTSYHACVAASYMFSKLAKVAAYPVVASEFVERYGDAVGVDSVVLAVSQSGETYDVLRAVEHSRLRAATILAVTNVLGSTLTRVSRAYILQQSGPEVGVAATKTFTSQLTVLAQLALRLARLSGKLSQDDIDDLASGLKRVPSVVEEALCRCEAKVKALAKNLANERLILFLGRGVSSATAMEGMLKLMEVSYIPSITYPAGESKHGPISLVEEGLPVVFICPKDGVRREALGNMMELKSRGAKIIALCEEGDVEVAKHSEECLEMPRGVPEVLTPIPYVIPLQLLAYYVAVARGLDPDKPRNLAKSVTVP